MIAEAIADRYSQALLEIALEKDKVDEYLSHLRQVEEQIERFKRLKQALLAPDIPPAVKLNIVRELFEKTVNPDVLNFICLLIEKEREVYLPAILKKYIKKVNDLRNIIDAEIVLPTYPSMEFLDDLKHKLSEATGKTVEFTVKRNPGIIGGFQLIIEDKLFDLSIRGQLERMGRKFTELSGLEGGLDGAGF
jgi:F-type H+-transporting ATPase subunit delta